MNNKKYFLNSISSVTIVNMFSMLITAFLTIVLPRYISKTDYSVWQLFVFYQGYLGFFHFGWNDGIYIRYGGKKYSELDKHSFSSQFWIQILIEFILAVGMLFLVRSNDSSQKFVLWQLAVNTVVLNSRYMLIYILQATARIKEYSKVLFVDRFFYIVIIIMSILIGQLNYTTLIYAETISKAIAYFLAVYYCRSIVIQRIRGWKFEFREIWDNISVGIKIMFSNIASMLLIGIIRFGIEKNWGIEVFGEISLTITLSQLFITFITSVGMVIFPVLKHMEKDKMKKLYDSLNLGLSVVLLSGMTLYYPGCILLGLWLPEYKVALSYMGLLLPICYYESKMGLLNNTYMKAMRAEKKIMIINCATTSFAVLLSVLFSFIFKNLTLSVFAIVILIAIRCNWFDKTVSKFWDKSSEKASAIENCILILFVVFNFTIGGGLGFLGYFIVVFMYLLYKFKAIKQLIKEIKF